MSSQLNHLQNNNIALKTYQIHQNFPKSITNTKTI